MRTRMEHMGVRLLFGIGDRLTVTAESSIRLPAIDEGCVVDHAVSTQLLAAEGRIDYHGSPCWICTGLNGTGTILSPNAWMLLCYCYFV
jgi:hypothetical protein